ncbi:MAG: DUF1499 domain-containing protein [Pseudomonadota bacterium]
MKMLASILIGLLIIVSLIGAGLFYLGQKSQDGDAPGIVDGTLAVCPGSPNCVVSEAHADDDHRVAPLPLAAWEKLPNAIGDAGGTITQINESYIASTFTSSVFKFVDDVEFRKADTEVHVRSASRVGYSDRGVNRERVEALRAAVQ